MRAPARTAHLARAGACVCAPFLIPRASAGYRVGYDDASHFNWEYKSLFGLPPLRDVEWLREAASKSRLQEARGH
jgi:hypothetical protein